MSNWKDITKEQFDNHYNQFPPNRWLKWTYKHFSTKSETKPFSPGWLVTLILGSTFALGFFGTVINAPRAFIGTVTFILAGVLVLVVFNSFFASRLNNLRLRKIRRILGLSIREYGLVVNKYYP
jgi:hypothetical protein